MPTSPISSTGLKIPHLASLRISIASRVSTSGSTEFPSWSRIKKTSPFPPPAPKTPRDCPPDPRSTQSGHRHSLRAWGRCARRRPQLRQHLVQIVHAKVDHRLLTPAKVSVSWENAQRPSSRPTPARRRPATPPSCAESRDARRTSADNAFGSRAFKKTPPTPTALAIPTPPAESVRQAWVCAWPRGRCGASCLDHARGLGLAHALAGVGLHRLGGRKLAWLAFRHGKDEYGID